MRTQSLRSISGSRLLRVSLGASLFVLAACGGAPPPAPVAPSKPIVQAEPPPDVSAVPEPAGLVLVGRITKSDAILKTLASWTKLPLPGGDDLIRSITDDSVAAAVDLSQPVDAAAAISGKRDPKPLIAVSVAVRSFDDAKAKLGAGHKLTPGKNGQLHVEGIGRAAVSAKGSSREDEEDEETCVLAHASQGARLVCGEKDALELLTPYLTRTVARQTWTSDIHVEMSLAAVREPLQQVRAALPFLAKQILGGTSPALGKLADAAVTEVVDLVDDTNRMTLDAQLADSGAQATLKVDYTKANSFIAKLATSNPARGEQAPPPAFWHLPADTDLALYGKGSDVKLFEHPRELLGNVALEITEGAGMPETERKAVRELVVDRMLGLFMGGPIVYGKGYDAAAVDKAIATRKAVKPEDTAARDAADHALAEQILGWHLIQVQEPITKVAPMLKDWAALWNRPAFAKWAKQESSAKMLAQMRMVGMPAGVTLPKDAVHLEIVIPRSDIEELGPPPKMPVATPVAPVTKAGPPGSKPPPPPVRGPVKKIPRKPVTLHVIAVPDQGGTWIGFGLDAKLLGQKAAAALSTAPDAQTLGKSPAADALRDTKANAAWMTTIRGLLFFRALKDHTRTPYGQVAQLPSKGLTPITLSFTAQPASQNAAGGSAVANLKLPRAAIEDLVKVMMSR